MNKLHRIYLVGVVLPFVYVFLADNFSPRLDIDTLNIFRVGALVIAMASSIFIVYKNTVSGSKSNGWYALGAITILLALVLAFALLSLSNFGF